MNTAAALTCAFHSGLTVGDTLKIDRPVESGGWWTPERVTARLEREAVRWQDTRGEFVEPDDGLLLDFLRLADDGADVETVAAFVRRWGPLRLCAAHGLPYRHTTWMQLPDVDTQMPSPAGNACPLRETSTVQRTGSRAVQRSFEEDADAYRLLARDFRAAVVIAGELHRGRIADDEVWTSLRTWPVASMRDGTWEPEPQRAPRRPRGRFAVADDELPTDFMLEQGRVAVGVFVETMLFWAPVTLSFSWVDQVPDVDMHPAAGVLSALATQLAFTVAATDGLAVCVGCGRLYVPPRRPRAGQRTWCDECRASGAPQRAAARDYQRRKRGGDRG